MIPKECPLNDKGKLFATLNSFCTGKLAMVTHKKIKLPTYIHCALCPYLFPIGQTLNKVAQEWIDKFGEGGEIIKLLTQVRKETKKLDAKKIIIK